MEVLFERISREMGVTARLTRRRSPTTTGKVQRFHGILRRAFLDGSGPFASVEAAQRVLDDWVHTCNTLRPHHGIGMQRPADRFRPGGSGGNNPAQTPPPRDPATPAADGWTRWEPGLVLSHSGNVRRPGAYGVWVGKAYAGRIVTVRANLRDVRLGMAGEQLRVVPSRPGSSELDGWRRHGARAVAWAAHTEGFSAECTRASRSALEVDRLCDRDGLTGLHGNELDLGIAYRGRRTVLRLRHGLVHAVVDGSLVGTWADPLSDGQRAALRGARFTDAPLPQPRTGPAEVQSLVPKDGVVSVAYQRIRVDKRLIGRILAIQVDDHVLRVLEGSTEIAQHAWTTGRGSAT